MKTLNKINRFLIFLIVVVAIVATSCKKEEIDPPHFVMPTYELSAGDTLLTIAQLKAMHTSGTLDSIKNNYWIKGIIIGNDQFGNIFKKLYIQDETGGIVVALNAKDMYTKYKQGQEIYVKCKNLVYALNYGISQLGAIYNGGAGQLAEVEIPNHLFINGWAGNGPTPVIINGTSDLTADKISILIRLDSVSFNNPGQPYVVGLNNYTSWTLTLKDGSSIILETSKYATFKDELLPHGKGSIIAILSLFSSNYQLVLRNTNDVFGFSSK